MSTTERIGVDRIFRTKNKVGSADSKYNVTNIGERTKKVFQIHAQQQIVCDQDEKENKAEFRLQCDCK